jgi:DNA-binding MarR family transcriptional regulator
MAEAGMVRDGAPAVEGSSAPPRWLNDVEQRSWLALGSMMMRLPGALDAQLQRDARISHFEYLVMAMLSQAPQRTLRMSQLASLANGSLSRLSHVVSRLERRGWVRRAACPHDGRATNAVLSDEGWAKVVESAPGHVERVRWLVIDALSPAQLEQLEQVAEVVLARIDTGAERAAD